MNNTVLYIITVLIWGSTWININYQLGEVAIEASIAYRFAIAAMLFFIICWFRCENLRYSLKQHIQLVAFGVCLFCLNFVFLYTAQQTVSSAITCITFSTIVFMNMLNSTFWFKTTISTRAYAGGMLGLTGITLMFWNDIKDFSLNDSVIVGVVLCLIGTTFASLGNMLSIANHRQAIALMPANAWGMSYGVIVMLLILWFKGESLSFSWTVPYISSLLYLSVFGSVIAFTCYLTLMNRMGANKASYANIMYPAVAVVLSTLFENFLWSFSTLTGLILVMLGNWVALYQPQKRKCNQIA